MTDAQISPAEIECYQTYVGRSLTETDTVGTDMRVRMAATLDGAPGGNELPTMWH